MTHNEVTEKLQELLQEVKKLDGTLEEINQAVDTPQHHQRLYDVNYLMGHLMSCLKIAVEE